MALRLNTWKNFLSSFCSLRVPRAKDKLFGFAEEVQQEVEIFKSTLLIKSPSLLDIRHK
jgi:hypothetical protein